ncbi:unnamed protein product [Soboliphyme baturini]|uniref:Uncharacterized protein n=1 Tax=Soboliphyme baturini TaxID=241478 RepID=A0A183J961_9BILA|nr:unnamed protein product [Soboliphyme baturini]
MKSKPRLRLQFNAYSPTPAEDEPLSLRYSAMAEAAFIRPRRPSASSSSSSSSGWPAGGGRGGGDQETIKTAANRFH